MLHRFRGSDLAAKDVGDDADTELYLLHQATFEAMGMKMPENFRSQLLIVYPGGSNLVDYFFMGRVSHREILDRWTPIHCQVWFGTR